MIISASRRTDIPAFYTPWFINRVREGFVLTRNPFNSHQVKRVSLLPKEVDAFVFWTRNAKMLMAHLNELDDMGYKYYFQYTITGYPKIVEPSLPTPQRAIKTFCALSDRIGANKVIWRYDPVLLSNYVNLCEHKRLFANIASALAGRTKKIVVSFCDFYKKTENNLNAITGLIYEDITKKPEMLSELLFFMADVAKKHNMEIETCAENIASEKFGISRGKCIDDKLLNDLLGLQMSPTKDRGQREACGCIRSTDIGMYNTCRHGCVYCYANFNKKSVLKNKAGHNPDSPFIIGDAGGVPPELLISPVRQRSLF